MSMYLVTHAIVFSLLPFAFFLALFRCHRAVNAGRLWFAKSLFWIVGKRIHLSGKENIDRNARYIVVSNYPSFYASFALMTLFPDACMVANAFISKIPVFGHFLKMSGFIFVNQKKASEGKRNIDAALADEKKRSTIIIFPEGKRTSNGEVQEFKRGFKYMLKHSTFDLLPVTLNGFYRLKPMGRFHLDPDARLEMVVHEPIGNGKIREMTDEEVVKKTRDVILSGYRP